MPFSPELPVPLPVVVGPFPMQVPIIEALLPIFETQLPLFEALLQCVTVAKTQLCTQAGEKN